MGRRARKTKTPSIARPPRRVDGLEINPVEDGFMIYRPDEDRVHYLNHTAVLVLELSNGRNTPARIATLLQHAYGLKQAPRAEVDETLVKMAEEGLIRRPTTIPTRRARPTRRRR